MNGVSINFYTKKNCPLCEEARAVLDELNQDIPLEIKEIDIYSDDLLLKKYQLEIPVVEVGGQELGYGQFSKEKLRWQLQKIRQTF